MKDAQTVKLEYGVLTIASHHRTELAAHEPDSDGDICIDIRSYDDETSIYLSTSQALALRDFLNTALSPKAKGRE